MMHCLGHDQREDSCMPVRYPQADEVSSSLGGTREQARNFLHLPVEVLSRVLLYLPTSSLIACLHVDYLLWSLISDHHFLDKYTRRTLGLSDLHDRDVRFRGLPQNHSPLMELWFLSHDVHTSLQDGARSFRRRENIFFHLDCFQHSLLTWLAQTTTSGTTLVQHISNSDNTTLGPLSKYIDDLPMFVLEPLTKLMFTFPDLIEATVWATHLSLHKGTPLTLQHAWNDGIQGEIQHKFECLYSLEVICGQTIESLSYLSAIIISFSFDWWILWTGSVTQYPGCRFEKTLSLLSLHPACTVSTIKESCASVRELVYERTIIDKCTNEQWKRHILYPGLCRHLNQINKKGQISLIENDARNKVNKTATISDFECQSVPHLIGCHHNCEFCSSGSMPQTQMTIDYIGNINCKSFSQQTLTAAAQNSAHTQEGQHWRKVKPFITSPQKEEVDNNIGIKHNKSDQNYKLEIHNSFCDKRLNSVNKCSQFQIHNFNLANLASHNVQKQNLLLQIETVFRHEILRFVCDPDSHHVLCPSCCKLWFPSNESLTKCIDQIKSRDFVPTEFWPYHILSETVLILTKIYG